MDTPRVIGIVGTKGAGKDTVATVFRDELAARGITATIDHLAAPIKKACREWFGFDYEQLYGKTKECLDSRWGFSPRQALQFIGTEVGHNLHPDVWTRSLLARAKNRGSVTIVADVRFSRQVSLLQESRGRCVWLARSVEPPDGAHRSETEAFWAHREAAYTLDNRCHLDSLPAMVSSVLSAMGFPEKEPEPPKREKREIVRTYGVTLTKGSQRRILQVTVRASTPEQLRHKLSLKVALVFSDVDKWWPHAEPIR